MNIHDRQVEDGDMAIQKCEWEDLTRKNPPKFDRVGDWDNFAKIMHDYIAGFTVSKYGDDEDGFDLMVITEPRICVWNILKYALRMWKGKGKIHDLHKIAHYAQLAFTLSKGDLSKAGITNQKGD